MLNNIKSKYILKRILFNLLDKKRLDIIKYNKTIQKRLDISIKNYKKYDIIIIEIIPIEKLSAFYERNKFINIIGKKSYYHIYFDESKVEINRNCLLKDEKVKKIIVKINVKIKSFKKLFFECQIIKEIKFKVFNIFHISDMSYMFSYCINLIKLDVSKLRTDKTINMCNMFESCIKLKELDLSNFNTNNLSNMNLMFYGCISLKKLNISNFLTFEDCKMISMFEKCKSLNSSYILQLYIPYKENNVLHIFNECSEELKRKIKSIKPYISSQAFI